VPFPDKAGAYFVRFEIGDRQTPLAFARSQLFHVSAESINRGEVPVPIGLPSACGKSPSNTPLKIHGDAPNSPPEILCGTSRGEIFYAGPADRVLAGGGNDRIEAANGAPNDISGGPGKDRAVVDRRYDRVQGVEVVLRRRIS
jgi:hypothetical protein